MDPVHQLPTVQPRPAAAVSAPPILQYAPLARSPQRALWVITLGLLTSALALVGVWVLNEFAHVNIMGWYVCFVLPAGAMLIGLIACSGYGIAIWRTGVKARKRLLCSIFVLQVMVYIGAQYLEFCIAGPFVNASGRTMGFIEYYHIKAITMAWVDKTSGEPLFLLGPWGYAFCVLELAGFTWGGLGVPAALRNKPYCELCQMYMRTRLLAVVPASAPPEMVPLFKRKEESPPNAVPYQVRDEQAALEAQGYLDRLKRAIGEADAAVFNQLIADKAAAKKAALKLSCRLAISLVFCPNCKSGILRPQVVSGHGKETRYNDLPTVDLSFQFVNQIHVT